MYQLPRLGFVAVTVSLAVAAMACGGPAGASGSGIRGAVHVGPQCPVVQAGSPCPDEPFEGNVVVTDPSGRIVATVRSGADGRFEVAVPPGSYVVTVMELQGAMFAKPVSVEVTAGRMSGVSVLVDTGIRGPVGEPSGDY